MRLKLEGLEQAQVTLKRMLYATGAGSGTTMSIFHGSLTGQARLLLISAY